MRTRLLLALAVALLASCSHDSTWYLFAASYRIDHPTNGTDYAFAVHINQLKQLGGEVNTAQFRHFVFERLTWHEGCEGGWQFLPCVADGSCVRHTKLAVTVFARCAKS